MSNVIKLWEYSQTAKVISLNESASFNWWAAALLTEEEAREKLGIFFAWASSQLDAAGMTPAGCPIFLNLHQCSGKQHSRQQEGKLAVSSARPLSSFPYLDLVLLALMWISKQLLGVLVFYCTAVHVLVKCQFLAVFWRRKCVLSSE